ncbi:hypothetical protein TNCV_2038421 [Trichonephila clavipes]|nr:hypothetical protein TNCV_2038421 [Trichonephila clavipes]
MKEERKKINGCVIELLCNEKLSDYLTRAAPQLKTYLAAVPHLVESSRMTTRIGQKGLYVLVLISYLVDPLSNPKIPAGRTISDWPTSSLDTPHTHTR